MKYLMARKRDIANGPGIRTSIWFSGCNRRCPNCFNPQGWDFNAGKDFTEKARENFVKLGMKEEIVGFSILGGEPLSQGEDMLEFVKILEDTGKNIWMWTGYTYEDLDDLQKEIVSHVDVLVDGPFVQELHSPDLRFRGSSNQRLIKTKETKLQGQIVIAEQYY